MVTLAKFNTICFVRIVRLFPACLAICLAVPSAALSAPREIRIPPVGETIKVDVMRGGSAVITMKAFEGRGNPLAYEFASRPRHGRLEDFQQADENRQGFASVVYVHGNDEDSQEDEFTFKARALIGGGVSSPIKVRVRIIDEAPQLQIVRAMDFSAAAGECESKQIELANIGGGLLEGRIAPKEPFYVEGEGRFSLGRGKTTNVAVRFAPQSTDSVAPQTLTPARANPGAKITLRGTANAPFSACVEDMQVLPDGTREGNITITNLSNASLDAAIGIEPRNAVEAEKKVRISKGEVSRTPMKIGADRKGGGMEIRVSIGSQHYSQEFLVRVPEVPADPALIKPLLDFRKRAEAALVVTNSGGVEARFDLELPENIKPAGGALNFSVAPEQTKEVRLHISDIGKSCSKTVFVDFRQGEKIRVAVLWPAKFEVLTKNLDFRNSHEATIELKNYGDAAGRVSLNLPKGIRALSDIKNVTISACSQTNLCLLREAEGKILPNSRVEVNLGKDGTTFLPIIAPLLTVQEDSLPWQLNNDVKVEQTAKDCIRIFWLSSKSGWSNALLETVREGVAMAYQPASEKTGWWDMIGSWWSMGKENAEKALDDKKDFFKDRLTPPSGEVEENKAAVVQETPNWHQAELAADDYQNTNLVWRVSAVTPGSGERKQASDTFSIDWGAKVLVKRPETFIWRGRDRKLIQAAVAAERTRAAVYLAIEHDSAATTFLLKPASRACAAQARATILNVATSERGGKKLTIVEAIIDNLKPGTGTFWRLVPLAGKKELAPTQGFFVKTKPPWTLQSQTAFLCLLIVFLALVLWLRHKQNRVNIR